MSEGKGVCLCVWMREKEIGENGREFYDAHILTVARIKRCRT